MIKEYLKIISKSIKHRKLRSWLTMLGIVIGIIALFSLISLGQGLENAINFQFQKFGANKIFVGPKIMSGNFGASAGESGLKERDFEFLKSLSQVNFAVGIYRQLQEVEHDNKREYVIIAGVTPETFQEYMKSTDVKAISGNYLHKNAENSAFIGYGIAKNLFDKEIYVKNKIKIGGKEFRVIGISEERGTQIDDNIIYVPIKSMWEITGKKDAFTAMVLDIKKGLNIEMAEKDIKKELEKFRKDENFTVISPKKLTQQIGQILGLVRWVLIGITAISLFVGGIGIMNSMYTSVLERTREIGIMKAVGATSKNILSLFLIEAGVLGAVGGIVGVLLSIFLLKGINFAVKKSGILLLKIEISLNLILLCILFSFIVGIISGALPSIRAVSLKPVEALRYE